MAIEARELGHTVIHVPRRHRGGELQRVVRAQRMSGERRRSQLEDTVAHVDDLERAALVTSPDPIRFERREQSDKIIRRELTLPVLPPQG